MGCPFVNGLRARRYLTSTARGYRVEVTAPDADCHAGDRRALRSRSSSCWR